MDIPFFYITVYPLPAQELFSPLGLPTLRVENPFLKGRLNYPASILNIADSSIPPTVIITDNVRRRYITRP